MTNTVIKQPVWRTLDGQKLAPNEMKTSHLFYTIRMLYNHSVPATKSIIGCRRYNLLHSPESRKRWLGVLIKELSTRKDELRPWQWEQLKVMRDNTAQEAPLLQEHTEQHPTL